MRLMNSSRDFGSFRNSPRIALVTVLLCSFWTPRITIHMCLYNRREANNYSKCIVNFSEVLRDIRLEICSELAHIGLRSDRDSTVFNSRIEKKNFCLKKL